MLLFFFFAYFFKVDAIAIGFFFGAHFKSWCDAIVVTFRCIQNELSLWTQFYGLYLVISCTLSFFSSFAIVYTFYKFQWMLRIATIFFWAYLIATIFFWAYFLNRCDRDCCYFRYTFMKVTNYDDFCFSP